MRPEKSKRCGWWHLTFLLFLLPMPALLAGCGDGDLKFPTEYQAVFLDNGQVFFGKVEQAGSSYLTLRDVYYVRRQVDQDKKEARNLLIKRGNEAHAPDLMRINTRHVVFMEPVGPDSPLAKLIREAKTLPAPAVEKKLPVPPPKEEKKSPTGK